MGFTWILTFFRQNLFKRRSLATFIALFAHSKCYKNEQWQFYSPSKTLPKLECQQYLLAY